jgi:hypothetical protein
MSEKTVTRLNLSLLMINLACMISILITASVGYHKFGPSLSLLFLFVTLLILLPAVWTTEKWVVEEEEELTNQTEDNLLDVEYKFSTVFFRTPLGVFLVCASITMWLYVAVLVLYVVSLTTNISVINYITLFARGCIIFMVLSVLSYSTYLLNIKKEEKIEERKKED